MGSAARVGRTATRRPRRIGAGRVIEHRRAPARRRLFPGIRTLDLYVARLFLTSWIVFAFSFTAIYVMVDVLTKLDRFLKLSDGLWLTIPRYHAAMVPTIFANYLGPVITAAAAVGTVVFLQQGNELEPMKASGVSAHRTLLPAFVLAAGFAGVNYFLQEGVIPRLRDPIRRAISLTHDGALRPEPFFDLTSNQLIQVDEYSPAFQVGRKVNVLHRYPDGSIRERITAREIVWVPDPGRPAGEDRGRWILQSGSVERWTPEGDRIENPDGKDAERIAEPFPERELRTSLLPIDLETSDRDIAYLTFNELKTQYWRQPSQRHLAVKLHHHIAFPLTHVLLPALAIPLVLLLGTRSVLLAVLASVLVSGSFFLVSSLAMSTAVHSDSFSPLLAAWLPVLLFGSLGVTLTANMRT